MKPQRCTTNDEGSKLWDALQAWRLRCNHLTPDAEYEQWSRHRLVADLDTRWPAYGLDWFTCYRLDWEPPMRVEV